MTWKMWAGGAVWVRLVGCPNAQVIGCLSALFLPILVHICFPCCIKKLEKTLSHACKHLATHSAHDTPKHTSPSSCARQQKIYSRFLSNAIKTHHTRHFLRRWFPKKSKCQGLHRQWDEETSQLVKAKTKPCANYKIAEKRYDNKSMYTTSVIEKLSCK